MKELKRINNLEARKGTCFKIICTKPGSFCSESQLILIPVIGENMLKRNENRKLSTPSKPRWLGKNL